MNHGDGRSDFTFELMEQPPVCTTPWCVNENITRTDLPQFQKFGGQGAFILSSSPLLVFVWASHALVN